MIAIRVVGSDCVDSLIRFVCKSMILLTSIKDERERVVYGKLHLLCLCAVWFSCVINRW